MNCPQHIREVSDPKMEEKEKERQETEDLKALLAGREEDYDS